MACRSFRSSNGGGFIARYPGGGGSWCIRAKQLVDRISLPLLRRCTVKRAVDEPSPFVRVLHVTLFWAAHGIGSVNRKLSPNGGPNGVDKRVLH